MTKMRIISGDKMFYKVTLILLFGMLLLNSCSEDNASEVNQDKTETSGVTNNLIPVEAMLITPKVIEQNLELTGKLVPKNSVDIAAEVSGKAIKINKELGEYVAANQTIAIIDDVIPESQYKQAQAQVLSAESNLDIAEANFKSDKFLFENGDISELQFNSSQSELNGAKAQHLSALASLSAAKKNYEDTKIKSPISGLISRKNIDYGTMVNMGTVVYRIVDLSQLKMMVSVPQEVINRVKIGSKGKISISALNEKIFDGVVKRISPQADESTGGFAVEIHVSNSNNLIKAGMTAKINLILSKDDKFLAVPDYAVVTKNNENYVYKINNDVAELVEVEIKETIGNNIVVEKGISNGDKIVIVGMKNLGIKTPVKVEKLY